MSKEKGGDIVQYKPFWLDIDWPFGSAFSPFSRLEQMMEEIFGPRYYPFAARNYEIPKTDILKTDKEYIIKMDMPGLKKDDIEVKLDNGYLSITGKRKEEKKDEKEGYIKMERLYSEYSRTFSLPEDAIPEKISANYKDGVLELKIEKLAEKKSEPKKIEIK